MMRNSVLFLILGGIIALFAGSCGNSGRSGSRQDTALISREVRYVGLPAEIRAMMPGGEATYKNKCSACHQPDGLGIRDSVPPLAQSDFFDDPVNAVAQVLNGSDTLMIVNSMKYKGEMKPQVDSREDAVAVVNYVLNNFGNKGNWVTLEQAGKVKIRPKKNR